VPPGGTIRSEDRCNALRRIRPHECESGRRRSPDAPRRNDLDGRGPLSEEALLAFTRFFLETCLDQVRFMEKLVQPDRVRDRIRLWVEEEVRANSLPAKAGQVLEAVLFRGELAASRKAISVCRAPIF
jgi:hypothetical protein